MPNSFSAGERAFLTTLAFDLHLTPSWDEYDEDDQNLVVLRFPGALESPIDEDSDSDSQDETEATAAVDRVLRKYDRARMLMENAEDNFDSREELRLKRKMDDWKRAYYSVRHPRYPSDVPSHNLFRINLACHMMTPNR